ncbi:HNH endonuclease signature motif containing protein [Devosia marina]|uniref:HNH endonuclease signature motif containing protein n=1 Tax=Devosia marina TaxID=2683198 RepID=UPI0032EFFEFB
MKRASLNTPNDWLSWAEDRSIPEPNSGCHLWLCAVRGKKGRGRRAADPRPMACVGGRSGSAFRLLWEGVHGPIPEGMVLCHTCDNSLCINLAHGFLGTQKENMQDCAKKKRQWLQSASSFEVPSAKFTPELLEYVRAVYTPRHPEFGSKALAKKLGMSRNAISMAINGHTYNRTGGAQ